MTELDESTAVVFCVVQGGLFCIIYMYHCGIPCGRCGTRRPLCVVGVVQGGHCVRVVGVVQGGHCVRVVGVVQGGHCVRVVGVVQGGHCVW